MESFVLSSASNTFLSPDFVKLKLTNGDVRTVRRNYCSIFANGICSFSSRQHSLRLRTSVIAASAPKKGDSKEKVDTHSFVPKPDEATGPFPEAVLLKEKKLQEDGRLLPEFADEEERELFEALNLQLESDINVERMRHYEVVYLIHEKHEKEVEAVNMKIQDFLREKKGRVWRFSDWGLRRLAYKIQKAKHARYILMNFEMEAKWINDFKSMLDKDERIIRHLVMKRDKAETEDCPPPPEFHMLRAGLDDEEDEESIDYDDDYEEDDAEEWDEGGEIDMASYEDDGEAGIIYVDDNVEDGAENRYSKSNRTSSGKRKLRTEEVVR